MPMTPLDRARCLHEPKGKAPLVDADLVRWVDLLPDCLDLAQEVQFLREQNRQLKEAVF